MRARLVILVCVALVAMGVSPALGVDEAAGPAGAIHVDIAIDSGPITNPTDARAIIFSEVISVPDARWLRVLFSEVSLAPADTPTTIRVTSLFDGASQSLDAESLEEWRYTTACLNGNAVLVEVIADPATGPSSLHAHEVIAGLYPDGQTELICGNDDRVSTADPRVARIQSTVCSAWMINDCEHCFLTAGHCMTTGNGVILVQFNVPPSDDDGFIQHPPPEFQFAVDPNSVQFNDLFGHDYAHFGCFPNSNTGMTPFETMGPGFDLFTGTLEMDGRDLAATGYGDDFTPSPHVNRTQQTDINSMTSLGPTTVGYTIDTTTGNSGSVVYDAATGKAIAIHTHGGCLTDGTGENVGTLVSHPILQLAITNPVGVCAGPPGLTFNFPSGLPEFIDPAGGVIRVGVSGDGADAPVHDTGFLFYDIGFGPIGLPMTQIKPNLYDATFPPIPCGVIINYFFQVDTVSGQAYYPQFPATDTLKAVSALADDASFIDDFENDSGWTVTNARDLEDGAWQRGIPAGFGLRGDPPADADGSGQCFLTANLMGNSDVDGGPTTLTSPTLDATIGDKPSLSYWRWFNNTFGGPPIDDSLVVEISDDDGDTWLPLESVDPGNPQNDGGWFKATFTLADVPGLLLTDTIRVRFIAADTGFPSIVEVGIDDVRMNRSAIGFMCEADACVHDCGPAPDGVVDVLDLLALLADWGGPSACDANDDGVVDSTDLASLIDAWGTCDE